MIQGNKLTARQKRFLEAYQRLNEIRLAAKDVGMSTSTHFKWRRSSDEYRDAFDAIKDRARPGKRKPPRIYDGKGNPLLDLCGICFEEITKAYRLETRPSGKYKKMQTWAICRSCSNDADRRSRMGQYSHSCPNPVETLLKLVGEG